MSTRSKPSSKKARTKANLERPFDEGVLRRARKIASQYRLVLEPDDKLGYIGSAVELPTGFADGATPDACVAATRKALTAVVATMIEAGQAPPAPVSSGKREAQVNIRLDAQEKLLLQEAARRAGARGLSDFIRALAIKSISAM